jgi:hypothetical protein
VQRVLPVEQRAQLLVAHLCQGQTAAVGDRAATSASDGGGEVSRPRNEPVGSARNDQPS